MMFKGVLPGMEACSFSFDSLFHGVRKGTEESEAKR